MPPRKAAKYRTQKASEIPYGQPCVLTLTDTAYENSSQYGPWWKWPIALPKTNALHQGEYDPEFAYLAVGEADLHGQLEAAYQTGSYPEDGRTKADVTITRQQFGQKGSVWKVTADSAQKPSAKAQASGNGRGEVGSVIDVKHVADIVTLAALYGQQSFSDHGIELGAVAAVEYGKMVAMQAIKGNCLDETRQMLMGLVDAGAGPADDLPAAVREALDLEPVEGDDGDLPF